MPNVNRAPNALVLLLRRFACATSAVALSDFPCARFRQARDEEIGAGDARLGPSLRGVRVCLPQCY
jgi:hypothetical protein